MANKLYVGNLAFAVSEASLEGFFTENGVKVEKVELVRDTGTGKSRGFGFVQLEVGQDMQAAIKATDGKDLSGRQVTVNEARERPRDSRGGGRPSSGGKGGRGRFRGGNRRDY
ncbi:MAG: RNA-binding protein [Acidobacteria bacterium]|nr:RNA-binding protein [Acidobacteriota bacterium]